jgi:hypothetical protein
MKAKMLRTTLVVSMAAGACALARNALAGQTAKGVGCIREMPQGGDVVLKSHTAR